MKNSVLKSRRCSYGRTHRSENGVRDTTGLGRHKAAIWELTSTCASSGPRLLLGLRPQRPSGHRPACVNRRGHPRHRTRMMQQSRANRDLCLCEAVTYPSARRSNLGPPLAGRHLPSGPALETPTGGVLAGDISGRQRARLEVRKFFHVVILPLGIS
jgi:hypothetical protein